MKIIVTFFLFIMFLATIGAQEFTQQFLNGLEDEELLSLFNEVGQDSIEAEKVARTYLDRARLEMDTIKMARGYDRLARIFHPEKNIAFADSIILLTRNSDHITYPTLGYTIKAYEYWLLQDLHREYENLLIAYDLAVTQQNLSHQLYILSRMIFAQAEWGDTKQALVLQEKRHSLIISKEYYNKIKKSTRKELQSDLMNLFLADMISSFECYIFCYLNLKDYDSAGRYVRLSRKELEKYSGYLKNYHEEWLIEASMEIDFYQGNYYNSIRRADTLSNRIDSLNDLTKFKNLNLFKGLSLMKLNQETRGLEYLLKSDSIYNISGYNLNHHYDRVLFERLYKYYSDHNETMKRIEYLDKMLYIDSILKVNYQYFEPEHINKFETPRLLREKESLIFKLEQKNMKTDTQMWWIGSILAGSLMFLLYYFNRQLVYKKRFQALLFTTKRVNEPKFETEDIKNEISSEIIKDILRKLRRFEDQKQFLLHDLSLQSMARSFHTNSNYLSRVINLKMERNFSQYIHDLRIDYSMTELLSQAKFRNYTIKAVAEECGYTNAESFSRAFYKKNGIYPSYYIKKLNKTAN